MSAENQKFESEYWPKLTKIRVHRSEAPFIPDSNWKFRTKRETKFVEKNRNQFRNSSKIANSGETCLFWCILSVVICVFVTWKVRRREQLVMLVGKSCSMRSNSACPIPSPRAMVCRCWGEMCQATMFSSPSVGWSVSPNFSILGLEDLWETGALLQSGNVDMSETLANFPELVTDDP